MPKIKLFVGLGNPGNKYQNTRHNFGFLALDAIAKDKRLEFKNWSDVADISLYDGPDIKSYLLKPLTFMNLSGEPVSSFSRYYKIKPEEIFVIYDDFSIPLGEYKIRLSGSSGGHNGIESIIDNLGTKEFPRLKLGIGPLPKFMDTSSFVLSKFQEEDKKSIEEMQNLAVNIFDEINKSGLTKAASKVSGKK